MTITERRFIEAFLDIAEQHAARSDNAMPRCEAIKWLRELLNRPLISKIREAQYR